MKYYLIILLFTSIFVSCNENPDEELDSEIIKVELSGTEKYSFTLRKAIPVEGGFEIREQAKNFQISNVQFGKFTYQAKEGFKGDEIIEIVEVGSIGDDNFTDYYKWVFKRIDN